MVVFKIVLSGGLLFDYGFLDGVEVVKIQFFMELNAGIGCGGVW